MTFKERLKKEKIRNMDLKECLKVNKNAVTNMVANPGHYISLEEAFQIRDCFFPDMSIDALFGEDLELQKYQDSSIYSVEMAKTLLKKVLAILEGAK